MEATAENRFHTSNGSHADLVSLLPPGYNLRRTERERGWITYTVRRDSVYVGSLRMIRYEDSHSYWLSRLYVKKAYRHQGIGRALIRLALQEGFPWRVARFIQSVGRNRVGLARLRRFYTRCGALVDESDVISWPAAPAPSGEQAEQAGCLPRPH
jgi:GNAT superfamily N-acetyltransferase